MPCGVPVVASNRASLPEVCGKAAVLVEPDEEELVVGIEQAFHNRADLIQRGLKQALQFSWKDTAEATLEVYRELSG